MKFSLSFELMTVFVCLPIRVVFLEVYIALLILMTCFRLCHCGCFLFLLQYFFFSFSRLFLYVVLVSGTRSVYHAWLELEICVPLPPKCWIKGMHHQPSKSPPIFKDNFARYRNFCFSYFKGVKYISTCSPNL